MNYLKNIFTLDELKDMNILTDYIVTEENNIFDKYVKDTSPKNQVKLKEQLLVYVISPTQENIDNICYAYTLSNSPTKNIDFSLIFIPGETSEIIKSMMKMEILKNYDIYNFSIEIMPIDHDLLSLELENSFKEIYINKNNSPILKLADVVLKLEVAFGKISNTYIKGDYAKIFNDILTLKEEEHNLKSQDKILGMIVLDRSVDFITPLLSNYTYEGLIDDIFGIKNGEIKVKQSKVIANFGNKKKQNITDKEIMYSLTSNNNTFFRNLRCMNFITANNRIADITNSYKKNMEQESGFGGSKDMLSTVTGWRDYTFAKAYLNANTYFIDLILNKLTEEPIRDKRRREISLLKGIAQLNSELFYDDCLIAKKDLDYILDLMILESLTQNGLNNYTNIKRDILNIYGYQNIFLLRNLESLGFLKEKEKSLKKLFKSKHQIISEKLNLNNMDDFKPSESDCLEYVGNGYCPISLKLVQKCGEGSWGEIRDTLQEIPGATVFPDNEEDIRSPDEPLNTIFLVFVGGITYTEIEGVRYLNRKFKQIFDKSNDPNKTRKQFIIVTTQILNSKKLYNSLGMNYKSNYTIKQFSDDINGITKTKKK